MKTIETFKSLEGYYLIELQQANTSCFNGDIRVVKYRVTVEKIKESKDVYLTRLQKMWDECDNHHHWEPLRSKANELGVTLAGRAGGKRRK